MGFQVSGLGKFLVTELASIRPFPRVHSHMPRQIRGRGELPVAAGVVALVHFGLKVSWNSHAHVYSYVPAL